MMNFHNLEHFFKHFKMLAYHLKHARQLRNADTLILDKITFRAAKRGDLKQIKELYFKLNGIELLPWLLRIYKFKAHELASVAVNEQGCIIGYDLFMFQEAEFGQDILHELYIGLDPYYQGQGLSSIMRKYSLKCYDHGKLKGISTLAPFGNIKALRSAQKAGFAITKAAAKPPAHYLFKALKQEIK